MEILVRNARQEGRSREILVRNARQEGRSREILVRIAPEDEKTLKNMSKTTQKLPQPKNVYPHLHKRSIPTVREQIIFIFTSKKPDFFSLENTAFMGRTGSAWARPHFRAFRSYSAAHA